MNCIQSSLTLLRCQFQKQKSFIILVPCISLVPTSARRWRCSRRPRSPPRRSPSSSRSTPQLFASSGKKSGFVKLGRLDTEKELIFQRSNDLAFLND